MDKLIFLRRWLVLGVVGVSILGIGVLIGACGPSTDADTGDSAADRLVKMVTVRSAVDPVPGHENHQLAMLLPPDTTGIDATTTPIPCSSEMDLAIEARRCPCWRRLCPYPVSWVCVP